MKKHSADHTYYYEKFPELTFVLENDKSEQEQETLDKLMDCLCQHPDATTLLSKALVKGPIKVEFPAKPLHSGANWRDSTRTILISKRLLQEGFNANLLDALLFELSNSQNLRLKAITYDEFDDPYKYAAAVEEAEHPTDQQVAVLFETGIKQYKWPFNIECVRAKTSFDLRQCKQKMPGKCDSVSHFNAYVLQHIQSDIIKLKCELKQVRARVEFTKSTLKECETFLESRKNSMSPSELESFRIQYLKMAIKLENYNELKRVANTLASNFEKLIEKEKAALALQHENKRFFPSVQARLLEMKLNPKKVTEEFMAENIASIASYKLKADITDTTELKTIVQAAKAELAKIDADYLEKVKEIHEKYTKEQQALQTEFDAIIKTIAVAYPAEVIQGPTPVLRFSKDANPQKEGGGNVDGPKKSTKLDICSVM